ncbi:MAG: SH3 domain-containing protein [Pseudomonadota bacterium]
MTQTRRSVTFAGAAYLVSASIGGNTRAETATQALGPVTNLPLPRFVSLRSAEINVRRGPGLNYPKDWVFQRAGLPVRIIAEHGDWRRILDSDNAGGWVYHALISGRRTVLITAPKVMIRSDPDPAAEATAQVHQGVIARLKRCRDGWCEITVQDVDGWAPAETIWGIDDTDMAAAR